jgi:hypothetical protein
MTTPIPENLAGATAGPEIPATFAPQPPVPLPVYEQPAPVLQLADQANTSPRIPEGGYAKRFVDIPLPELNLPGIECKVRMRNPGMMSQGAYEEIMNAIKGVPMGEDGKPDEAESDLAEQLPVMQAQFLKLIASWTVWDAESAEDVPPLLPSPPTSVEDLKRAPMAVMNAMVAAFKELQNPR